MIHGKERIKSCKPVQDLIQSLKSKLERINQKNPESGLRNSKLGMIIIGMNQTGNMNIVKMVLPQWSGKDSPGGKE